MDELEKNMDKIVKIKKHYALCSDAENEIRKEGLDDVKFSVGDQWGSAKATREDDNRPCLTINKIPQFVKSITNEQRRVRPAPKAVPVGKSDIEVADIYTGIMKYIYTSSQGDIAIDTACENQVTNGWGYIRIATEYCDEESFNQDIKIKRVKNPFSIMCDPMAKEADYSDMRFAFVIEDMAKSDFEEKYPKASTKSGFFEDAEGMGQDDELSTAGAVVRVVEYWYVEETPSKLYLYEGMETPVKEKIEGFKPTMERDVIKRSVKVCVTNGFEILEEKDWAGKYIPIIPVLGRDVDVDGKRYLYGLVRPMKDAQRMYNYWNSAATEVIALAPKAPFIAAEGQIKGYEEQWKSANIKNLSVLPYVPVSLGGKPVPPPQRNNAEQPIQAMSFAISQASEDMKATTGIYDAGLGQQSNETSGKGIIARQKQGALANHDFPDNLTRSVRHLGRVLIDLIPKIYDAPRVVMITDEKGDQKQVQLNEPFVEEETGIEKMYDLNVGKYDVVADVGSGSPTKRQEEREELAFVLQTNPEMMQVAGDLYFDLFDAPYAKDIAKRIRGDDKKDQNIPPEVQAKLQELMELSKALTQQLNEAKAELSSKDADRESKERIAAMNNKTSLLEAELKNNFAMYSKDVDLVKAQLDKEINDVVDNSRNSDNISGINAVEQ
jgi:hypothetical protein